MRNVDNVCVYIKVNAFSLFMYQRVKNNNNNKLRTMKKVATSGTWAHYNEMNT